MEVIQIRGWPSTHLVKQLSLDGLHLFSRRAWRYSRVLSSNAGEQGHGWWLDARRTTVDRRASGRPDISDI